jgi:5-formyltetrahydrofolate cyclo-ligase
LVPLLAYDLKGNRVGYGKGYYDRFLAECRPDALKIGFSYFEPEEQINDTEDFDIPLNYCVTPHRCYEFG